jgi:hypothetical protein
MYGPLDYIALSFEGNQFKGEILPALAEFVAKGTVRIIDLAFVSKDQHGNLTIKEIEELNPEQLGLFHPLLSEINGFGMLSRGDLEAIGSLLDNNSSAALILWENSWATTFAQAVVNANGRVLARETVPYELVQEALNAGAAGSPSAG